MGPLIAVLILCLLVGNIGWLIVDALRNSKAMRVGEPCPRCNGRGRIHHKAIAFFDFGTETPCPTCRGRGTL